MRHLFFALALLLLASTSTHAQNCQPRPSAVAWLDWYANNSAPCGRVDFLFWPEHEAWWCGGNWVMDFPPEFTPQSGTTTARLWYFEWRGFLDYTLWPWSTVFCRCNVQSCEPRAWR